MATRTFPARTTVSFAPADATDCQALHALTILTQTKRFYNVINPRFTFSPKSDILLNTFTTWRTKAPVPWEGFDDTRTHKIFYALDAICYEFDLSKPIWLDKTIADFKKHAKARFYQDNFVDSIDFDYLEIQIIEE